MNLRSEPASKKVMGTIRFLLDEAKFAAGLTKEDRAEQHAEQARAVRAGSAHLASLHEASQKSPSRQIASALEEALLLSTRRKG